jgi:putative transposase
LGLPSSVIRLVGAVVADRHDEWQSGERHYRSEVHGSTQPASDTGGIVAIDSGESTPRYLTAQPAS